MRTIERMRTQTTVLCVEDETIITYSTRPKCEGLEVIGRNQTTAEGPGCAVARYAGPEWQRGCRWGCCAVRMRPRKGPTSQQRSAGWTDSTTRSRRPRISVAGHA